MTDRELLELASRAYGLDGYIHEWINGPEFIVPGENHITFNPLRDDGDALQLATTMCFSVIQYKHSVEITIGDELIHRELSDGTMTRIELTRHAIVRAAAAIQLSKEGK